MRNFERIGEALAYGVVHGGLGLFVGAMLTLTGMGVLEGLNVIPFDADPAGTVAIGALTVGTIGMIVGFADMWIRSE